MTTYTYDLSVFTNGFDFNQFQNDVINSSVGSNKFINSESTIVSDQLNLIFYNDLSEDDKSFLDYIVANHVPVIIYKTYFITPQVSSSKLDDGDHTLTPFDIYSGIIEMTPIATRTITIPSDIVRKMCNMAINTCVKFVVINNSSTNNILISLAADVNRSNNLYGSTTILPNKLRNFILRIKSVKYLMESFDIY